MMMPVYRCLYPDRLVRDFLVPHLYPPKHELFVSLVSTKLETSLLLEELYQSVHMFRRAPSIRPFV
jgi:hypothetical protein